MASKLTPLMQQYGEIKARFPEEIVLFRMGDFFEMFDVDAETAAPILGIALTQRNKKVEDSARMCGVPHHSIAGPIAKLLAAGHKVAMCDQIEDPATAKGLVKRDVTRVLTPGMVYDPDTLDQLTANYLASYDDACLACVDVTTGEAFTHDFETDDEREELLGLLRPVELVLTHKQKARRTRAHYQTACSAHEVKIEGAEVAIDRLRSYVERMQGAEILRSVAKFEPRQRRGTLRVSAPTFRHLEVFESSRGERKGSLFDAINRTQTSAGGRLLRSWLTHPLRNAGEILRRQDEVAAWLAPTAQLKTFRERLAQLGDVERRLGKVHGSTFNARDLSAIARSLLVGASLSELHPSAPVPPGVDEAVILARRIESSLADELPLATKEGGLIRRGVSADLDELIDLTQNAQRLIFELEAREREATGVSSLKIRYNSVFGYYVEMTKTHAQKAPAHYRRKQTLVNAERFTTDELDELEKKILSARSRRDQLEFEIFAGLREEVIGLSPDLLRLGREWTRWDVLSSFAWSSVERSYVRPEFNERGRVHLELARHPVVEQTLAGGFVPNTVTLAPGEGLLLTGPNMAGKSTLMRQVALIALMAQIGAFVPATRAELPLFDEIFSRIGASDALNEGLSTFMVEMTETAAILRRVTDRSLVVMDEIGRGTSTYDGLSLAQAILEFLLNEKKPYLLFATHYHELTKLAPTFPQLLNAHMSVQERGGEIQFLHTLRRGPANRSYGIHVAKLAGLPAVVTSRANHLLRGFEAGAQQTQLSLGDLSPSGPQTPGWIEEVRGVNISKMTPLEALNKLFEWQREASS